MLAIGPSITLDDDVRIQAALEAFDRLTSQDRTFISLEYIQLLATFAKDHQDLTLAVPVQVQLLALPSTVTLSDETSIRAAQAAFDALSQDQQTLVSAEAKARLQQANQQLNVLLQLINPGPTPPSDTSEGLYIPWIILVVLAGWGGGYYLVQLRKKYLL